MTPSSTPGLILNCTTYIKVWLRKKKETSCACLSEPHVKTSNTASLPSANSVLLTCSTSAWGLGVVLLTVTAAVVAVMIAVGKDLSRTCSQQATNRKFTTPFSWSWHLKTNFFWENTLSGEQPGGTGIFRKGTFLRLRLIWCHYYYCQLLILILPIHLHPRPQPFKNNHIFVWRCHAHQPVLPLGWGEAPGLLQCR